MKSSTGTSQHIVSYIRSVFLRMRVVPELFKGEQIIFPRQLTHIRPLLLKRGSNYHPKSSESNVSRDLDTSYRLPSVHTARFKALICQFNFYSIISSLSTMASVCQ